MGRMGPSFSRSKFSFPLILLGFLLMVVHSSPVPSPESIFVTTLRNTAIWTFIASLGIILVLIGAPTYYRVRPMQLISGWIFVGIAWMLYLDYSAPLTWLEFFVPLAVVPGILLPIVIFAYAVQFAERSMPILEEAPELNQKERDFVTSIISRNLRRSEAATSGEQINDRPGEMLSKSSSRIDRNSGGESNES